MIRRSFFASLFAIVLARLGLRRPKPVSLYAHGPYMRIADSELSAISARALDDIALHRYPLRYRFRGTTYEVRGPGKTVEVPAGRAVLRHHGNE